VTGSLYPQERFLTLCGDTGLWGHWFVGTPFCGDTGLWGHCFAGTKGSISAFPCGRSGGERSLHDPEGPPVHRQPGPLQPPHLHDLLLGGGEGDQGERGTAHGTLRQVDEDA